MSWLTEVINQGWFSGGVVPLVTLGATMFTKWISQNDRYTYNWKDFFAVGFDISTGSLILVVTQLYKTTSIADPALRLEQFLDALCNTGLLLLAQLLIAVVVRKLGWQPVAGATVGIGRTSAELTWFWGVIVPLLMSGVMLYLALKASGVKL
jgi:hypothetical protein